MDNFRRKLLVGAPALALTGCATPVFKNAQAALGTGTVRDRAVPRTPDELLQAEIAEKVFGHFSAKREIIVPGSFSSINLRMAKAAYVKVIDDAKKKEKLTLVDSAMIGESMIPLLRAIDQSNLPGRRTPAASSRPYLSGGKIMLPPGGVVSTVIKGLCMDRGLAPPVAGEPLRLAPIEKFIVPSLIPLYREALVKSKSDTTIKDRLQEIIWMLRDPGKAATFQQNLYAQSLLNLVHPQGAAMFERAYRQEQIAQPIRAALALADSIVNMDPSSIQNTAASFEATQDELSQLRQRVSTEPIPRDNSQFSMANNGQLAVMGVGADVLTPRLLIINASNQPATFDPMAYAAISPRSVQRTAMPPAEVPESSNSYPLVSDSSTTTQEEAKSLLDMLKHDATQLSPQALGFVADPDRKTGRWLAMRCRNPATKALFESIPFVGNALSAYSLISGKDWLSGEPLSAAEYLLNAMGTIPGAGQIGRLAGRNLPKLVSKVLNSSAAGTIGKVGDFVAPITQVADINDKDLVNYFGLARAKELVNEKIQTAYTALV